MKHLLTSLLAAALILTGLSGPARADEDPVLAKHWQYAWDFYRFYECITKPLPWTGRDRADREISIEIDAPAAEVFATYSDVNNHLGAHSFLKRVVTHKDWTDGGVRNVNFTAVEDVPVVGDIPLTINTHAQQRIHLNELYYETDTWTLPNVVTHQKIVFTAVDADTTKVTEYLAFESNILLLDFTATNGVASHVALQSGLKAAIESGAL